MSITLYVFETKVKAAKAIGGETTTTHDPGQDFLTTGNLKGDDDPVVIWTDDGFGGGTVSLVPATGGATVTFASGQGFVGNVTTGNLKGDDDPVVIWTANDTISMVSAVGGNVQVLLSHVKYIDGIAVGDFNGDSKLDVVASSYSIMQNGKEGKGTIWMLLGNGDGTFQSSHPYSVDSSPLKIVVGDFNRDDKLDIATSNLDSTISVLLGNGDGTFQSPHLYSVDSSSSKPFYSSSSQIVVADFNRDGKLDIAIGNSKSSAAGWSSTVSVLLGNGDGIFQPAKTTSLPANSALTTLVAGDLGENGKPAIAVGIFGALFILRGNGDGTFQNPTKEVILPKEGFIADMTIDSFKRNKKLGIYWIETTGKVRELISNGDGTFQAPRTLALTSNAGGGMRITVGDFGKAVLNVVSSDDGSGTISNVAP